MGPGIGFRWGPVDWPLIGEPFKKKEEDVAKDDGTRGRARQARMVVGGRKALDELEDPFNWFM